MLDYSIDVPDVEASLVDGETIEEYEDGSRLVLGRAGLRPVHVVVREDDAGGVPFVITVYEPDEQRWDATFRHRRRP